MKITATNKGFSTVEMLIAMTVMSLMLGAIMLVIFGSQTFVSDASAHAKALSLASLIQEEEEVLSQKDFNLLSASSSLYTIGSTTYAAAITVELQPDYATRKVTTSVTWQEEHARTGKVSLVDYVADYENAASTNTCSISGDWSHPTVQNVQTNFAQLVGDSSGIYSLGGVDAYKGRLYVTATVSGATKKNFFIFDTTAGPSPQLLGSLDTTGPSIGSGGAAVVVATSSQNNNPGNFAYVANAYNANFATCTPKPADPNGGNCAQLQIFDVTNPAAPVLISNYLLPTTTASAHVTGSGSSGAVGSSIFYKDGYIYLGLTKTTTGPEFNIIDVHNPHSPAWVGGYKVGYVVNAIYVADNIAYIAHPTDSSATLPEQVTVLSLTDKSNPVRISGYKAPDKQGNGKSLYRAGSTLYIGRTVNTTAGSNDAYVLHDDDPANLVALNPNTPQPLGIKLSSSINALLARGQLLFLLSGTSGTPGSLNIFNPAVSTSTPLASLALPGASSGAAMDCEGNTLYAASNDLSNKGYLSVIYP